MYLLKADGCVLLLGNTESWRGGADGQVGEDLEMCVRPMLTLGIIELT